MAAGGAGNSELKFYGEKVDNKNPDNSSTIGSRSNTIDGKYVLPLGEINQLLTFGGEWRHNALHDQVNLKGGGGTTTSASQYALFMEDEWRIIDPLTLTAKGGWSTDFKAPSLLQLSPDWTSNSCRGSCKIVGSAELKPETSENWEIGLYYAGDTGWLEGVDASVTTFQNDIDDMIDIKSTSNRGLAPSYSNFVGFDASGNPIFPYYNVNKARIRGVETSLKVPFGEQWKVTLNYTYNDGRDVSNGGSKALSELPLHTANGVLDWKPLNDWSFYISANYTGEKRATTQNGQTPGGYVVWDVGGAWQATRNVKLRAGVLNVGDKNLRRDDYGYNEDGLRYFVALDYRF